MTLVRSRFFHVGGQSYLIACPFTLYMSSVDRLRSRVTTRQSPDPSIMEDSDIFFVDTSPGQRTNSRGTPDVRTEPLPRNRRSAMSPASRSILSPTLNTLFVNAQSVDRHHRQSDKPRARRALDLLEPKGDQRKPTTASSMFLQDMHANSTPPPSHGGRMAMDGAGKQVTQPGIASSVPIAPPPPVQAPPDPFGGGPDPIDEVEGAGAGGVGYTPSVRV
jgi:hypothetical protein